MTQWSAWLVALCMLLVSGAAGPARADVIILIHGYFSGDDAWSRSGITSELEAVGWESGGGVTATGTAGDVRFRASAPKGAQAYYLADLPSEAPLMIQSAALKEILAAIRAQRGKERTILVGHSAGGVVARLLMVQEPTLGIDTLITIATPHLGTDKAEVAGLIASTPLAMMAPVMGLSTLNRSKSLYDDLTRERPGTLLYWLNRQPHPKARYDSIVRRDSFALFGDNTVPTWSQDMGKVVALHEQARPAVTIGNDHALERADGVALVRLLREVHF
ncbi:MAG: alpha/beta fold hydrolase [Magnetococcales bacterium]|nr:alpha/beta fold hydrolase [Magnetococcales bacterium]